MIPCEPVSLESAGLSYIVKKSWMIPGEEKRVCVKFLFLSPNYSPGQAGNGSKVNIFQRYP